MNQQMEKSAAAPVSGAARVAIERRFEQALYAYHRGDYSRALIEFERASEIAARNLNHEKFVECCTYVLRILAEREEFTKITRIEAGVFGILSTAQLPPRLKSRALYVLGISSCYQDTRHDEAMNRFREAIDFAIISGDKDALAAPLYGAATVLYARGRYQEALREIERLDILLSCLSLPDIASATCLLKALIRRNQKQVDEALAAAWTAFESLKHHPHLVLYLHTLCVLGSLYHMKGETNTARLYLDLASRSLKRDEFPRIARLVDEGLAALGINEAPLADLVFDTRTGILIEKCRGEIRFEGQFVLRDLLRLFMEHPGQVFSKAELVRTVWNEDYKPETHDNKIYVTIKRLRKLLEAPHSTTEYILRAKSGYFFNPKVRVLIDDKPVGDAGTAMAGHKLPESV
jgi:tetratricopeptide (TPR) repeat protein